ncbi:hypothetical protein SZ25_00078 [Candidatus Arcanobacter lacustris]|uniref:Uncharacterized protein n=1 Tax=Candidatus Arcanibacter lacustris TaxID=1607817 RepID=A0A0F5MPT6_9RICK|nr:hypothetical protein SZ25_00078 [Candidatus Arcanobacter lacustris]
MTKDSEEIKNELAEKIAQIIKDPEIQLDSANPSHMTTLKNLKQAKLEDHVKGFLALIDNEVLNTLNKGESITGKGGEQRDTNKLAKNISRDMLANIKSTSYTEENNNKAIESFNTTNRHQYRSEVEIREDEAIETQKLNLVEEIKNFMKDGSNRLNLSPNFSKKIDISFVGLLHNNPNFPEDLLILDDSKRDKIIAASTSLIAKIGGKSSPFNNILGKSSGMIPANVMAGAIIAGKELVANNPDMNKRQLIEAGKIAGKKFRQEACNNSNKSPKFIANLLKESEDIKLTKESIKQLGLDKAMSSSSPTGSSNTPSRSSTPTKSRSSSSSTPQGRK